MTIAEILELPECRMVEPEYADLISPGYTDILLTLPADEARLLVDEFEDPLALAVHSPRGWVAGTFLHRPPTRPVIDRFADIGGDIYQDRRSRWADAVRRYYSSLLCAGVAPAQEDLPPDRREKVRDLLEAVFGAGEGEGCIDACCGSGVGSAAFCDLNMVPCSYDHDAALLVRGLSARRLSPDRTVCIDAALADRYLAPAPRGVMLMAGQIYSYTAETWKEIIQSFLRLAGDALFTTGTREEAELIADWCWTNGRRAEVWEQDRDPLYDRWCCRSREQVIRDPHTPVPPG